MKAALVAIALSVLCAVVLALPQEENSVEAGGIPPMQCVMCMNVVAMLETQVTRGENSSALLRSVDTLCTRLHIEDWCVTNLKPKIIAVLPQLLAKLDPAKVCSGVKLCTNNSVAETVQKKVESVKVDKPQGEQDTKCMLCSLILGYVKQFVGSNQTEAAIKAALDKACAKIPFAKDLCTTVLEPYITQIIEGIVAKEDPATICAKIKLCKPTPPPVEKREAELNVQCELCTAVLAYVKTQIGSDNTQANIQNALTKACSKIPFAKGLCSSVLQPYITQIVNGFVAKQDPATICGKMKLCN
jgi:saposin